ncbi:MAG: cation-transporting P-type ATPase [Zoogloea sp.]|nr:cation-transporting P-type ATPase [Zoogloea sp.]
MADGGLWSRGARLAPLAHGGLMRLVDVAVLCNEVEMNGARDSYVLNGSATESALVEFALACGVDVSALRLQYPLHALEHRSEGRNYMRSLHQRPDGSALLAVKGSPAEVLAMCRWWLVQGVHYALTEDDRAAILEMNDRLAGDGLRVLGFACCLLEDGAPAAAEENLVWLGLAGLADPVRRGVAELMGLFHQAGIKTVMITGDQSQTAWAIGQSLGLSDGRPLEIMDSVQLERIAPERLPPLVEQVDVFARVSPANKLQIVQGLQRAGKVVAMTGDGINDGPALRAADIGVAMGASGTDTARAVADVVIEDDELQTMIIAVSEGRTIYNNIRKAVHFLTATNLSEILVMLSALSTGMGQPLNTMQLLWINLLTDIFPALALAVEPPEPDVLSMPPRDPAEPIIRPADLSRYARESLALTAGALASYGYGLSRHGPGARAGTIAFMTLTLGQLLHALTCRSDTHGLFTAGRLPSNPQLKWAIGASVGLQALAVAVPGLRGLLGTTPLGAVDTGIVLGGAALPFLLNEAAKAPRLQTRDGERAARTPRSAVDKSNKGAGAAGMAS